MARGKKQNERATLRRVLGMLLQAYHSAQTAGLPAAKTAQEADMLRRLGLTDAQREAWLEEGILAKVPAGRTGRGGAAHAEHVYLTRKGAAYAEAIVTGTVMSRRLKPHWYPKRHELWLGGHLILRFKRMAPNQEPILNALQDAGWPSRIENPLPKDPVTDAGKQLRETLESLNEEQEYLRFHSDSNGASLWWELVRMP